MTFRLFLLLTFFLIGRPQDFLTFLAPLRPTLILTIVTFALTLQGNRKAINEAFRSKESKKFALFYLMMILSIPLAVHRRIAFEFAILVYLSNILYFYIFLINVDSARKLKTVIFVICCSVLFYSALGLIRGNDSTGSLATERAMDQEININPEERLYFGIYDPNDLAFFLVSLFPLAILFIVSKEGLLKKAVGMITLGMSIVIILLTGSRGGLLGLLCFAALFFLKQSGSIKRSTKMFVMVLGMVVIVVFGYKINMERFTSLTNVSSDYNVTGEGGRLEIWKKSVLLIASNPVTGVGVNCFAKALGDLRADMGELPKWQSPHNSYVQVATETGLLGFFFFYSVIVQALKNFSLIVKSNIDSDEGRELKVIATTIQIGFVSSLIVAFFLTQAYNIIFVLYLAFSMVLGTIAQNKFRLSDGQNISSGKARK
jgi:O-antigen ligase